MKVAGQQHYEIDGEAKELTPILNDWYEKVAAALKAAQATSAFTSP